MSTVNQSTVLIIIILSIITKVHACSDSYNNKCDFCLSQNDFADGTFRIMQSGVYCIEENIIFNPGTGNVMNPNSIGAWFPTDDAQFPGCIQQKDGPYALGFFAVISIETNNVKLDLNGYTISYHEYFYLQQRFGSIIEIANQPFLPSAGPTAFGTDFQNVENITICNGELGLTSHHGIHSNNASNIIIENINIYDFEVAGIQLNGFKNVILRDINIGPSLQSVPLTAFYSNARFLLLALRQLLNAINMKNLKMPSLSFAYLDKDESLTLQEIHDNLVDSMDLIFRYLTDEITYDERQSVLYSKSLNLFKNRDNLPDGSAIYGVILNSHSVAVDGFGDANNEGIQNGQDILIEDVVINDLKLKVREVIAMYFDKCNDSETEDVTVLKGPFGDVMSIKEMINPDLIDLIDKYDSDNLDLSKLQYIGNPLSDAQIALFVYKDYIGDNNNYAYRGYVSPYFLDWALNHNIWPKCAAFVCNGDIMAHTNKGVVGLRMDGIENAEIKDVIISNLENRSPLVSSACSNYSGPTDGGNQGTKEKEGGMSTDMRGLSVIDGDLSVYGRNNIINNLQSWYGDTVGIDLMEHSILQIIDNGILTVKDLSAATKLRQNEYLYLLDMNATPYPNNFNLCNISIDDTSQIMNAPKSLEISDCKLSDFRTIQLPQTCDNRCDGFSVLLIGKVYDGDNICLTYNVKRLHDMNICRKSIKYVVLGVCEDDVIETQCNEIDLNGLIQSVSVNNDNILNNNINAWGTKSNNQLMGIRVNIDVNVEEEFTICLKDVFNVNDEMSDRVRIRRGKNMFLCKEEYTVGLPCIDNDKFKHGMYTMSGYNIRYIQYGNGHSKRYHDNDDSVDDAIIINHDIMDNEHELNVLGWSDGYIVGTVIGIIGMFCIIIIIIAICLWRKRPWKKQKYHRPDIDRNDTTNIQHIVGDQDEGEYDDNQTT